MVRNPVPAIVLFPKTRNFAPHCLFRLHVKMGKRDILLGVTLLLELASHSGGSTDTLSGFMLKNLSSGLVGSSARVCLYLP